jgi:hypothetical protein
MALKEKYMAQKKLKAAALLELSSVENIISQIKTDFAHRMSELKTDQEKSFFQDLTQTLFNKLSKYNTTSDEISKIAKQLFIEFRGDSEVGLYVHFSQEIWIKDRIAGKAHTDIKYGMNCHTYSEFLDKLLAA